MARTMALASAVNIEEEGRRRDATRCRLYFEPIVTDHARIQTFWKFSYELKRYIIQSS